jgi:hypothetical protein
VTNVAKAAKILLSEVEDGLGERHEVCRETKKWGDGGIDDTGGIQVESVDSEFHEIESS